MEDRLLGLKELLGIVDDSQDELLRFVIDTTLCQVLSYLGRDELPHELEGVLLLICASYWKGAGLGEEAPSPGAVASVKRGDVETRFAAETGGAGAFDLSGTADGFFGFKTVLGQYRKVKW